MKAIKIEPSIMANKPSAYIDVTSVSMTGIDGEERTPWASSMSFEDLMRLLEDE